MNHAQYAWAHEFQVLIAIKKNRIVRNKGDAAVDLVHSTWLFKLSLNVKQNVFFLFSLRSTLSSSWLVDSENSRHLKLHLSEIVEFRSCFDCNLHKRAKYSPLRCRLWFRTKHRDDVSVSATWKWNYFSQIFRVNVAKNKSFNSLEIIKCFHLNQLTLFYTVSKTNSKLKTIVRFIRSQWTDRTFRLSAHWISSLNFRLAEQAKSINLLWLCAPIKMKPNRFFGFANLDLSRDSRVQFAQVFFQRFSHAKFVPLFVAFVGLSQLFWRWRRQKMCSTRICKRTIDEKRCTTESKANKSSSVDCVPFAVRLSPIQLAAICLLRARRRLPRRPFGHLRFCRFSIIVLPQESTICTMCLQ